MCLGALYYCSPDEVVFLTTRDAYEPHYVDDRKYFELDTFYQEFAKPAEQRRLPMRYEPHEDAIEVYRLWQNRTAVIVACRTHHEPIHSAPTPVTREPAGKLQGLPTRPISCCPDQDNECSADAAARFTRYPVARVKTAALREPH